MSLSKTRSCGFGLVLGILASGLCSCSRPENHSASEQPAQPSRIGNSAETAASSGAPQFKLYREKDGMVALTVHPATTDKQLIALLWTIRTKVRSHRFQDLQLKEGVSREAGIITIYRRKQFAGEQWSTSSSGGEHDDAYYQWGIDGDRDKDRGVLINAGTPVSVFDASDHWKLPPDEQKRLDQEATSAKRLRETFASTATQRYRAIGLDISAYAAGDDENVLVFDSEAFKDRPTRVSFISHDLPLIKKDLCRLGFKTVEIRQGSIFADHYSYSACN